MNKWIPKTNVLTRALICPFLDLYPTYHPTGEVQVLQKAWELLPDDVKASLQRAEYNLNALNSVDLGPKRHFSVGECALWVRLTGPRFAGQVAAAVSLVEASANHCKASTVAKEVMAIRYGNRTSLSIENFLEAPFAAKHPKLIKNGTEAAAALRRQRPKAHQKRHRGGGGRSGSDSRRCHRRGRIGRDQASGC